MKNEGVQAIIGPQTSAEADFPVHLGQKSQIPILCFSVTSPSLSSSHTPYFIRATPNDSAQARPIAALAKAYNWREAVAIYEDTEYGASFIPYLRDALQEVGSQILFRCVLSPMASEKLITKELNRLMAMQTRVFIVHMMSSLASRLFLQVQQLGMMSKEYVWIITDGISNHLNSMDPTVKSSMQGVIGVKAYIQESKHLAKFTARWEQQYKEEYSNEKEIPDLNVFGLRAYDATWALALAIEKSGTEAANFRQPIPGKLAGNMTDLSTLRISISGPKLLRAILESRFRGLTGQIRFINGELLGSKFQIVNIVKEGVRDVGFWSPESGLLRGWKIRQKEKDLRRLIWPGGSAVAPKGWVVNPNGKEKLRIGVPFTHGKFVTVEEDPISGAQRVTGFSVDVFAEVVKVLPYNLPYELVPFGDGHGKSKGTYDELVYQVFLGNYDAVVGDVTIIANRSNYVDFTPPYTDSGVSMIVPVKRKHGSDAWTFFMPLTWEVWLVSTSFFFIIAFVIWFLENGRNKDFQGPLREQMGKALYFSFSTLTFSHRDRITSNLTRVVIILWLFLLLVLSSSYTANLASILTVKQLEPTVTDIQFLIRNGDYVGYQNNSFLEGLLKKLGIPESKLRAVQKVDDNAKALSKGSSKGGVAAIFDEIPYIKSFLSGNLDKFTMAGPTFKTGGFGFVLPKNSPMLSDISRAVLNVTDGGAVAALEKIWFGEQTTNPNLSNVRTSYGLQFDKFLGLFLMVGTSSIAAMVISSFQQCNDHRS
ncbi:glutamate receptor 2.7 isoform X2 [Amborella trichopoda]|nr:glutamate receptor 2.7 isoform X2 [Amborella trichopoda]|eukprot:XP_020523512.1 glutamate receptor 2.7 isoform X2 [Amborella trichopoda]